MLGKIVRIKRNYSKKGYISKVGNSIYCGDLIPFNGKYSSVPAYLISKREPRDKFSAMVIGVVNRETPKDKRIIVAPKGFVYYEPEIRDLLSKVNHQAINSLVCRYEKSCGAIIVKRDDVPKVLLVKNKNSRSWGFPKGHVEKGETERQTALREVLEETGLAVTLENGFREISDYYSYGNAKKRVVFFLAITDSSQVEIQTEELEAYKWLTFDKAVILLEFKNNINILKKAFHFINYHQLL